MTAQHFLCKASSRREAPVEEDPVPEIDLSKLMDDVWERYVKTSKQRKSLMNEESVHNLRISIRRLQAVLDLARPFLPKSLTKKTRESLNEMRKMLGRVRDLQVQIRLAADLRNSFPNISKFQKALERREKQTTRHLKKRIHKKSVKLEKRFANTSIQSRGFLRMFTRVETERTIAAAVDEMFEEVLERKRVVEGRDVSAIHDLRTKFKRFRYAIESVRPLFPDASDEQIARMREMQQLMGHIQDAEMLFEMFSRWAQKKKMKRQSLAPIYDLLGKRRRDSINALFGRLGDINTFAQFGSVQNKR